MDIDWSLVFFEILNFGVLVAILKRFLFRPVRETLEKRRKEIEALQEQTARREAAAETSRREYEDKLHAVETQVEQRLDEAIAQGREQASTLIEEARAEAHRLVEGATEQADEGRRRALEQLRLEVLAVATDAAARVVRHMGAPSVARAYARRAAHALLDTVDKHALSEPIVTVTGADADPSDIEAELRAVLGDEVTLSFETDPQIVGGVRLQVAGHEIEASASASLRTWYDSLVAGEDTETAILHSLPRTG